MAWLSRTVWTVWHVCWPRSPRACAGGSWGRPPRRAVPSGATGGKQGAGLGPRRAARTRSAARAPTRLGRSRPPRSPRGASPARSRTGWAPPPARAASPVGRPAGPGSPDEPCAGPCRTAAPARLGAQRSAGRPRSTAAEPQASAMDRSGRGCTAGRCAVVHRAARPTYGRGRPSQRVAPTAATPRAYDWSNRAPQSGGSGDRRTVTCPSRWPPVVGGPGYHQSR